ncbi:hypothetical protein [Xanthomonas translucens]|uniref:hypothetical protein n=1 Tax=Xanthomonas campestris pv. translucens TaxID=343 RepID=UPI0007E49A17|nr:hypothetical protein [Xanthomonas translucens]MCS3361655.1 hypothetical protein [Xanthomonas translucens pv. translucens]MCS3375223.1 hypothetical protein [Xanthomonas translucens pv. translucens]MCT8276184.1 hypothetical protein [Xanthomonas translucens pv. translucens]MCT8280012.1 hypothetical protein [Xanthomonas translucens pv. translucens]MCT8291229.1 hypothetical protein [Xanthomonas translucens pv. translucens]
MTGDLSGVHPSQWLHVLIRRHGWQLHWQSLLGRIVARAWTSLSVSFLALAACTRNHGDTCSGMEARLDP